MTNTTDFTAAIIGAGRVGVYHAKAQLALGNRVVVYEPNPERAVTFQQEFGQVVLARTLEEAVAMADVVHICTPPMYRLETALQSVKHRKPTIIEKPLAFTLSEAVQMYKAAMLVEDTPVILATSFRVGPAIAKIYDEVRTGGVGTLASLETSYVHDTKNLEPGKTWRKDLDGTAFLYEGGSHGVDLNMWMADQPVEDVQAIVSTKKTREEYQWVEDFAVSLRYRDGLVGRVWINASAPMPRHGSHVEVYGSDGAYRVHSKEAHYESYIEGVDSEWMRNPIDVSLTMKTMNTMSSIFNDYIQGRRKDFKPMPDIADGLRLMIVMETIEKAITSGRVERVPTLDEVLSRESI